MANISICSAVGANTYGVDCDVERGIPVQLLFGSVSFAPADYADQDTLEAAILAAIRQASGTSSKLFPMPVIQGTTDKTVAAKFGTLGYGLEIKLLRSKQGYEFDVLAGTDLEKRLIAFDNKTLPVLILDDASNVWGIKDSSDNFKGAKYRVGVEPRGFGDAQNPKTTKITISLVDSRDFVENSVFATTSFNASDLVGLLDVETYSAAAHSSNVFHIGVKATTNQLGKVINLHDYYATELAATAAWAVTVAGVAKTLTSVANDTTNGGWTITVDSTEYTAISTGAVIKFALVAPPALAALDVTNLENTKVYAFTK